MTQLEILRTYFGYTSFRTGQEVLIESILRGEDALGIMPTGAGKSLCYQVPALMMDGITLVVSPLISLMKDQVTALNQAGIHAAYINSSLTERQVFLALENAKKGQYKIIYVAPERLETPSFLDFAVNSKIAMVTIDEAHCISQWGQDFRPSYLKIVEFIRSLPRRPVVSAFTATATQEVKEDIICILGLQDANVQITGFNRENLFFEVRTPEKKTKELLSYLREHAGESGIVYCATRKNVDKVYELLCENGMEATRYHAGLTNEERQKNQEDFIFDKKPVMVATNAFGMGIDKSNVRFVVHFNMPQSIENYYQEAGRAGRDGEPSECVLLYSTQDIMINHFLIESSAVSAQLSYEDAMVIQERDEIRLNQMVRYCLTKQCLRNYILNYFGEKVREECNNCSNCLAESELLDVTKLSVDIIHCIKESRQRYGTRVVIGTLRGETYAKLMSYGVNKLSCYGIAKEENVPPYIVFSDKSLVDMCIKLPFHKEEMLKVNGVGENKFERYGERFLHCIVETCNGDKTGFCFEGAELESADRGSHSGTKKKKHEFVLTEEIASQISYVGNTLLSEFVNQINELRDETTTKRLTAVSIVRQFVEAGYVIETDKNGRTERKVTEKGIDFGLRMEVKRSQKGFFYEVFSCTEQAQHEIVRMLSGE